MEETLAELPLAPRGICRMESWGAGESRQRVDRVADAVPLALVYTRISHDAMQTCREGNAA
jgi:hypothetical protein